MICDFCKKEYKEESKIFTLFGNDLCLHDDKIKLALAVQGMSIKNDYLSVTVARGGKDSYEEKYIEESKKRGNTVVRGSDGLLREIGKE